MTLLLLFMLGHEKTNSFSGIISKRQEANYNLSRAGKKKLLMSNLEIESIESAAGHMRDVKNIHTRAINESSNKTCLVILTWVCCKKPSLQVKFSSKETSINQSKVGTHAYVRPRFYSFWVKQHVRLSMSTPLCEHQTGWRADCDANFYWLHLKISWQHSTFWQSTVSNEERRHSFAVCGFLCEYTLAVQSLIINEI